MKIPSYEPYRIFFLTGTLMGFWGAAVWVLFYLQKMSYPAIQHPALMMGGFLLSFVCGFLMTAAPKFTGSFPMTSRETLWSLLLNGVLIYSSILFDGRLFYLCSTLIFITLAIYFLRRFLKRTQNPPTPFVFIGLGLGMGFLGSLGLWVSEFVTLPEALFKLSRLFYLQGYILSLIVGVGSRLVPALLGHAALPNQNGVQSRGASLRVFVTLMLLFAGSYILEGVSSSWFGPVLKNSVILFVALRFWKVHQLPKNKTRLAWGLIIASWLMLIGLWGSLWTTYRIHFLHVFFIGGLGMMTFMIAVRVVLSHGNHGLVLESKSRAIPVVIGLIFGAAITRLSAGFLPAVYLSHLAYAALVWCAGVILWSWIFIPRVLKTGGP